MRFGLTSPILGKRTNVPQMLLEDAFTPELTNVTVRDGEIERCKMRAKELVDADGNKIACPLTYHAITALAANTFTVAGDQTAEFTAGDTIRVNGSTDNDGLYTVVSATYDVDHTDIVVVESVDTSDVDGNVFVSTTPILRYHELIASDTGLRYLFVFTAFHIWRWTHITKLLTAVWSVAAGGGCSAWDTTSFNDNVIATNNSDAPLRWLSSTPAVDFVALTGIAGYLDKARFVTSFENVLVFGHITESSTIYPQRGIWCDFGDETAWGSGNAGYVDISGSDAISASFAVANDLLYIFKQRSVYQMWLVTTDDVFNNSRAVNGIGCEAPDSVVVDAAGHVFYYGTDGNFREIQAGEISQGIDSVVRLIEPHNVSMVKGTYITELGEVWWAIPYGTEVTQNSRVIKFSGGRWFEAAMAVAAFGKYRRQAAWDWDDLPWDNWDDWPADDWLSPEGSEDYPTDICGDYGGYSYALRGSNSDDGTAFASDFVVATDFNDGQDTRVLSLYKRLRSMELWFRSQPSAIAVTVEVKRDGEPTWQPAGTLQIGGDTAHKAVTLPVDYRARSFEVKISSTADFHFIGMFFDYSPAGDR